RAAPSRAARSCVVRPGAAAAGGPAGAWRARAVAGGAAWGAVVKKPPARAELCGPPKPGQAGRVKRGKAVSLPRGGSVHDSCPDCAGAQPKRTIILFYPELQSVTGWIGPVTSQTSLTPQAERLRPRGGSG